MKSRSEEGGSKKKEKPRIPKWEMVESVRKDMASADPLERARGFATVFSQLSANERMKRVRVRGLLLEAVAEARATMRVVMKSCQDKSIEATPVWSLNYKGAVHVRVFDKNGTQIDEKYAHP